MTPTWIEIALYVIVLLLCVKPLGAFMAHVLEGHRTWFAPLLGPVERLCYRIAGVNPAEEVGWKRYAIGMLLFNVAGLLVVVLLIAVAIFRLVDVRKELVR